MKIVIDMTEDFYKLLTDKEFDKIRDINLEYIDLVQKIKNGTILQENHGRLIDADALYEDLIFPNKQFDKTFKDILNDAQTIIEADKAESEE